MRIGRMFLASTFALFGFSFILVQHVQCKVYVDASFAQNPVEVLWSEKEEGGSARYTPDWASLDKRPLPSWYDEAKIGIFIHFGVFAVPSFGKNFASEWFWEIWKGGNGDAVEFMKKNYRPSFQYGDFAAQFTAEFYDADRWAELFDASGARYVVLTSKHHEGFTNWPSNYSFNWNSMDVGPKRDIVGELAAAVKKRSLHFGLYHSMYEWFNPLYLSDKANKFSTQDFVMTKTLPELYEIVKKYKPELIWSDGDWEASYNYWNSTHFLAWLFNDSPVKDTVVVNDRWGVGTECKHGSYYNCNDRFNPGKLVKHKWENAMTIDKQSWGFRRNALLSDYLTTKELLTVMAETISCGGNLLVNVGPTKEGTISPIFEFRLRDMGAWLKVNGEAIYSSQPWTYQNDTVTPGVWYTSKKSSAGGYNVYAIVLSWPTKDHLELGAVKSPPSGLKVSMLGYSGVIQWSQGAAGDLLLKVPVIPPNQMPCQHAWVFKMEGLSSF